MRFDRHWFVHWGYYNGIDDCFWLDNLLVRIVVGSTMLLCYILLHKTSGVN